MRRMRIGMAALAVLLSACACTQIGCANRVEFHLATDLVAGSEYAIETCIDGACREANLIVQAEVDRMTGADGIEMWVDDDRIVLALEGEDLDGNREATLVVRDDANRVVSEFSGSASFIRSNPNGALCGPTCWHAVIDVPEP